MRRWFAPLMLLAAAVTAGHAGAAEPRRQPAPPPAPRCSPLVAAPARESDPPIAWVQDGRVVGAGPDLLALIGRQLGLAVEWHGAGPFDLLVGMRPDDPRAAQLEAIAPRLAFDPVSVMVLTGTTFPYREWTDLRNRTGIAVTGEGYGPDLDKFVAEQLQVRRVDGNGGLLTALMAGRADYAIGGRFVLTARAARNGVADRIVFLEPALTGVDRVLAMDPRSPCRAQAARIGALLATLAENGTVATLMQDAFARWGREKAR